jgi:hypothetical protein
MAKITQINNGDSGLVARTKINTALSSVETDATITGNGNVGTPLSVDPTQHFHSADRVRLNHTGTQPASTISDFTSAVNSVAISLTGFESWGGTGNYYSLVGDTLTLLRAATGRIAGVEVVRSAGVSVTIVRNATCFIYFGLDGVLSVTTNTSGLYSSNIALFKIISDATNAAVSFETHPAGTMQGDASAWAHRGFGNFLGVPSGQSTIGGDIARVATGSGGAAGDRQLKIVGNAVVLDHGIETALNDSAGAPVSFWFTFLNGSGQWVASTYQNQFPMTYNAAGVATAIPSGRYSIFSIYTSSAEPNSGLPTLIAVMDTTTYANLSGAQSALNTGVYAVPSGYLSQFELARLGFVIAHNTGGGYLAEVRVSKSVANATAMGGGVATTASAVEVSTTNLNGILAGAANAQAALEVLDDHTHPYQPLDNELTALAGVTSEADKVPYFTGFGTAATATFTAFGRSLMGCVDAGTGRSALGLGSAATVNIGTSGATIPLLNGNWTFTGNSGSMYLGGITPGLFLNETDGAYDAYFVLNAGILNFQRRVSGFGGYLAVPVTIDILAPDNQLSVRLTGVGIGTATPHPSAKLDLQSTTQGMKCPTLTSTQEGLVSSPVDGLWLYNSTLGKARFRENGRFNSFAPIVAAPATAASTGVAGDTAYDANYFYVCVSTNTWKRAALSTW